MKKDYINEMILSAVELNDIELLTFVLSRDVEKDVFKDLVNVVYKDSKNIYEYLLINEKDEMLNVFIKFGFWAHIHMPINKYKETLLEAAYRMNNLPIVVSLLGNENAGYNENSDDLNEILTKIKSDYQTSLFLLNYINKKVITVEYPEELTEDKINESSYEYNNTPIRNESDIILEDTNSIDDEEDTVEYSTEDEAEYTETETATIEGKKKDIGSPDLDVIIGKAAEKFGTMFRNIFSSKKENHSINSNQKEHILSENEVIEDNEPLVVLNDVPTTKEIKERINENKEDPLNAAFKNMVKDITIVQNNSNASIERFDFNKDDTLEKKKLLGLLKDISSYTFNTRKERIAFILRDIVNVLSTNELVKYGTIKNFISLMNDYNIRVLPKIESLSVSSFELVFEDSSFSLSSLESVSMKELRDVLSISSEDDLFLINEKINYLETNNKKGSEYLRLLITKTYLESKSLRDFINKLKDEGVDIETSIKDFSIITAKAEELKKLEDILTIYKYKKDDIVIDDEDLPESIRYCEIRDSFKNK